MERDRRRLALDFHRHLHDVWGRLAGSVPGGWVERAGGLRCIATGSSRPTFNLALTSRDLREPSAALDAAGDRFRSAGLDWLLKLQPGLDDEVLDHARRRGMHLEEEPVYAIALRPWTVTAPRPSTALSIDVAGAETIDHAVRGVAEAFDADPGDIGRELGPNLLTIPTFTVFIGHLAQEPVATAMLATTRHAGVAGIYSVATRPAHRGRGFATAVTAAALAAAAAQGYDTAVLEPSPAGAPMYRRMGFAPLTSTFEAIVTSSEGP
ncbi:MAG: GNAT family N-acetyltransferase [Nitriliruptoraceae bacterium]|nr:GNAT family N-acetyltransferase [Nitriliruptoraceae bacterium]